MRACLPESLLANVFLSSKVKDCIMIFKWVLANARYFSSVSILGQEEYEEDGSPDLSTIKPLVDGGTEGFKGHARVIIPGITPCFHCSLWLFPPQITFPLCTLAETPRSPAHCIEYAHLIQWGQDRIGEYFDADNPEHMKWIYDQALKRGEQFNISGITYSLTQGVVKNIVPAIASTNAVVAATCALETLKIATMCSTGMDIYMQCVLSLPVFPSKCSED
jgi:ubiquitin-activating enzyme E1 C